MSDESRSTPAPGPKAGEESDQKRTDEEIILQGIAEQLGLIDAISGNTSEVALRKAPHQRKLGQLEFKYQLHVEQKRLARALSRFEEEHGALYSEPCLICLENAHVNAAEKLVESFICCGGFICKTCAQDVRGSGKGLVDCPLCRQSCWNISDVEVAAHLMALAERGVAWAQADVGKHMIQGTRGFEKQGNTGLKWLNKAAAQDYPSALYDISRLYRDGVASILEESQERANELLLESANLGYSKANSWLAQCHLSGKDGFEEDLAEAYFRSSVAFALDENNYQAAKVVGILHHCEEIPAPSTYLACYYQYCGKRGR